ncbi:hypothetical protein N9882_00960 [Akkermansiaceae bacterium]|nr:hypothetical protein [Akkermansiaceae bacterium]
MKAGERLKLGLPRRGEGLARTFSLYQPQTAKAVALKWGLRQACSLGGRFVFPKMQGVVEKSCPDWIADPNSVGILFGNPSHKSLRAAVCYQGKGGWEVAKLIEDSGSGQLENERAALEAAAARGVAVPRVEGFERLEGCVLLRMEFLESEGVDIDVEEMIPLASKMLSEKKMLVSEWKPWTDLTVFFEPSVARDLGQLEVSSALSHGDFAKWNVRKSKDGFFLIDWEYGSDKSLSGLDLVHLFSQEAELVEGKSPADTVSEVLKGLGQTKASAYLSESGWNGQERELMMISYAHTTWRGQQDQRSLLNEVSKRCKNE